MRKLTGLCTVTLAAVAFVAAPAAAHETDPWSAPTTSHGSTTDRDLCPPGAAQPDGADPGTDPAQDAFRVSPAAVGDAGPAGSQRMPASCAALTVAQVGSVPEAGPVTRDGRWTGSGNAAVLFVAGVGAMAVTGSAVVAHRRNAGTR